VEKRTIWDEAAAPKTGVLRRCPICEQVSTDLLCTVHSMATLLVDPPAASVMKLEVGSVIAGRYVIKRVIGRGGYGAVFEATHTGTGQGVAVKTLAPGLETDETALKRFFQEARATSGLRHPNTIRVFDFGQDDSGLIYLAMELLTGVTLKQELKKRQKEGRVFTEAEAIAIGMAITKSLGEAHAAGLVHRDLKPDNVYLHQVEGDDPVVKVLDFGIVKLANSSLTLGSDSGIPGTPAFMSPEQVVKRGEIDGRSDLYSLGVVLYNLVTGTVPYKGTDVMQTLYMHIHEPIPDVKTHAQTAISEQFADLIHRTLSKEPGERPKDAREMRTQLAACAGDAVSALSSAVSPVTRLENDDADPTMPHTTPSHRSLPSTVSPFNDFQHLAPSEPRVSVKPEPNSKTAPLLWAALALVALVVAMLGTFIYLRLAEPKLIEATIIEVPVPPIKAPVEEKKVPEQIATPPAETVKPPVVQKVEKKEAHPVKTKKRQQKKRPSGDDSAHEVLDEKI
jgi:serine/threonine protein kinase